MKPAKSVLVTFLIGAPLSTFADTSDISDCKNIVEGLQRLACYDRAVQREAETIVAAPTAVSQSDATPEAKADSEAVAEFGSETVEAPPVDFIEAKLVGDFNGWSGATIFTLDNGQVWKQTSNYIRDYKPRDPMPEAKVTISRGIFGSYDLRVEGVKRIVQVKRIK